MNNEQKIKKKITLDEFRELISKNRLSLLFFYAQKADENWLVWLWDNGFLDTIIKAAQYEEDKFSVLAELGYLRRMVEVVPEEVAAILRNIIKEIPDGIHNTNIITCLLDMTSVLPAPSLELVLDDIYAKKWISYINKKRYTFMMPNYKQMLETLAKAKRYKCLLTLATNLMMVVDKKEVKQQTEIFTSISFPFYYRRLSEDNIWKILTNIEEDQAIEQALDLATNTMANIIMIRDKSSKKGTFKYHHSYEFETFDFFTLKLDNIETWRSEQEQVKLVVLIKSLFESLINKHPEKASMYYTKYIGDYNSKNPRLPDTRVMWRLRLCLLSVSPKVFSNKLRGYFSRLFGANHYYDIMGGAEYGTALQKCFPHLSKKYQREYFNQMVEYFTSLAKKKSDEEKIYLFSGSRLLSVISKQLSPNEMEYAKEYGLSIKPHYEPAPMIQPATARFTGHSAPITEEKFAELSIAEIVDKLCNDWRPDNLANNYPYHFDDSPAIDKLGVAHLLKKDISKRLQDYINESKRFFEPGNMDALYTDSYLGGVSETIQEKRKAESHDLLDIDWGNVLGLCINIIDASGNGIVKEEDEIFRVNGIAFITKWKSTYLEIATLLEVILSKKSGEGERIDVLEYRGEILKILNFLLRHPDPPPEFVQKEKLPASQGNRSGNYLHSDKKDTSSRLSYSVAERSPVDENLFNVHDIFSLAINSVRGRTFMALIYFMDLDIRNNINNKHRMVADDFKTLYEDVLTQEQSRAVMFLFGYYFNYVYTWDKKWAKQLLPQVFSKEYSKNILCTATWEGFLSGGPAWDIFFNPEIQELYQRGLKLSGTDYPEQKHYEDPQLAIARHLALVFVYKPQQFDTKHKLFKQLWTGSKVKEQSHFVNFIGRVFISNSNQDAYNSIKKDPLFKQHLINLWDWVIQHCNNLKVLAEFGYWIPLDGELFDKEIVAKQLMKTIERTDGTLSGRIIDEVIVELAEAAPQDTLKIIDFALLGKGIGSDPIGSRVIKEFSYEPWKEAIRKISTKAHTATIIRELLDRDNAYLDLRDLL